MYTIDASVWVNAFDQREPGHLVSRQFLEVLRSQMRPIIVPNVVLVEVAGAISRTRRAPAQAQAFATALSRLPHVTVRVLDEVCALHALTLAAQHGLRGADAVYAAVAREAGSTLVTLDNEHLTQLVNLLTVCTPAVEFRGHHTDLRSRPEGESRSHGAHCPGSRSPLPHHITRQETRRDGSGNE